MSKQLTINGVTKPIKQWAKESGLDYGTLWNRIERGTHKSELLKPALTTAQVSHIAKTKSPWRLFKI